MQARAQFKRRSTANNVQISIPVPEDADTPKFRTNIGSVHYAPETSSIVWKIKQFGGGKEFLMRAELGLPSVRGDDEKGGGMMGGFGGSMGGVGSAGGKGKRPIQVKFEIPYFTTSGIQVRYLKIIEPKVSVLRLRTRRQLTTHSYNILACLGSDILHRAAILLSGCQICNKGMNIIYEQSIQVIRYVRPSTEQRFIRLHGIWHTCSMYVKVYACTQRPLTTGMRIICAITIARHRLHWLLSSFPEFHDHTTPRAARLEWLYEECLECFHALTSRQTSERAEARHLL